MPYKSDTPECEVMQRKPIQWGRVLFIAAGNALVWFAAGVFASPTIRAWYHAALTWFQ